MNVEICYVPDTAIKTSKMYKISTSILLFLLFAASSIPHLSAQTVKDIFKKEIPVTYLGIDFTLAKVIGESADAVNIRDQQFPAINNLVITQPNKYDIASALRREAITSDLAIVNGRNRAIPVQQIKSDFPGDFGRLNAQDIGGLVSSYDFSGKSGIGLLLVAEGMSNAEKAANIYVTFINLATKKILLTERIKGKAGGFGFRNYWASAVEDILKKISKPKYDEWKKKYAG